MLICSAFTAIGTIGACVIALHLSRKSKKRSTHVRAFSGIKLKDRILLERFIYHQYDRNDLVRGVVIRVYNDSEIPFKINSVEYFINGLDIFKDNFDSIAVAPYGVGKVFIPISEIVENIGIVSKITTIMFMLSFVAFKVNTDYDGKIRYFMSPINTDKWVLVKRINRHFSCIKSNR